MNLNYYEVLGIPKHANDDEVKKAYRKLVMQHHPDRNHNSKLSEEIFKKVQIAFEHLSDPVKRKEHDECLMGVRPFPQAQHPTPQNREAAESQATPRASARAATDGHTFTPRGRTKHKDAEELHRRKEKSKKLQSVYIIIFVVLLLVGGAAAFYFFPRLHTNSFDAAVPRLLNNAEKSALTAQVATADIELSNKRVEEAMRAVYGRNFVQDSLSKCWLGGGDSKDNASYCMQPFSAYSVYTRTDDLLYLLAVDKRGLQSLTQKDAPRLPLVLGVIVYDVKNEQVVAQDAYKELPADFRGLSSLGKPERIACNGAFAWHIILNDKQAVLYATKGARIVDLFQQLPEQYLSRRDYSRFFLPSEKDCVYEMRVQNLKNPRLANLAASFDNKAWSYRIR